MVLAGLLLLTLELKLLLFRSGVDEEKVVELEAVEATSGLGVCC